MKNHFTALSSTNNLLFLYLLRNKPFTSIKYIPKLFMILSFTLFVNLLNAQNMETQTSNNWRNEFNKILDDYGHRNWILITDKAFPKQSAAGMQFINTNNDLLPTLQYVLDKISLSTHVKPVIYTDKELLFITEDQIKGIKKLRDDMTVIFKEQTVQTLLHEDVFNKLDESSSLFETLVLKTNCTIPYSSVFIYLDCAYWSDEKEQALRSNMTQNDVKEK